uniref:Uncharacterized protein n=1 Tax=Tanacetum cinerariifolium TaxID=118510 RepID=A0A699IZH3_TANCI|nr:hypothetical protein CTI12_AA123990 [Tanacetum cinerariifolium]
MVALRDLENLHALLQREGIDVTMFTDWFELNKRDPPVRTITYAEIPEYYVWHEKPKLWKRGKQQRCIELMRVNKRIFSSFKEACFAYGLLNDDKEWTHAISEASFWALGP